MKQRKESQKKDTGACRNMEKGSEAADAIKSETGNVNIESRPLDLESFDSVRNFAKGLKGTAIYALDNNAEISGMKTGTTEDGYDIVFQSNHLGHFLLTNLLLPQIEHDGRILNISSDIIYPVTCITRLMENLSGKVQRSLLIRQKKS